METLVAKTAVFVAAIAVFFAGLHTVDEGHLGVYWRGGALLNTVTEPGFHFKMPFLTTVAQVQVTMQTDSVKNIDCGTSGGVIINFERIEVVNQLKEDFVFETVKNYTTAYDKVWIFDKVHHEINQFCSKSTLHEVYISLFDTLDESLQQALQTDCDKWAPGIDIIAVRVTKPRIPETIRKNFERMEAEKTKLLIAEQAQKVVILEAETERKRANLEASKIADVSAINMKRGISTKESEQRIASIENEMHLERERAVSDAEFYRSSKEADANTGKLTPEFLEYMRILSIANNTKVFFGDKIPSLYVDSPKPKPPQ